MRCEWFSSDHRKETLRNLMRTCSGLELERTQDPHPEFAWAKYPWPRRPILTLTTLDNRCRTQARAGNSGGCSSSVRRIPVAHTVRRGHEWQWGSEGRQKRSPTSSRAP